MAQLKKFMFDNFVIETRPEADEPEPPVDEETAAEPVSPTAQEENVSAESPAETAAEPELEAEPEPEVEPEPEEEEFIPEPLPPAEKSYTQSEVDEMVNTARQEGYEQGFRSSQNGVDAEANTLLMDINQKLAALLSETADIRTEVENQALEMVKVAVLKLVPTLMADEAAELVSKFIADNFNNFKDEAKLSFYIHPDIISYAQQKIAALANSYDFEGKIALHKDASLAKSDCRIEWENGGVELKEADQLAKVADLLDAQKM